MKTKRPSKQIYALMIIAATAIFCALIFKNGNPFKGDDAEKIATPQNMIEGIQKGIELNDTDSDGLYDWEETLRGTDMTKADTDADGTSDGSEVNQGRNPLIPGPNDSSGEPTDNSVTSSQRESVSESDQPKTLSSELSKNLLTQLVSLKGSDSLTAENKAALLSELTQFTIGSFTYKKYDKNMLLLLNNFTPEELRVYASNFATIQIDLISSISAQGDEILKDILVLSRIYRNSAQNLSQIAVPSSLADVHLTIVNNYSAVSTALEAFQDDSDPARKAVSIGAYQSAVESQEQMIEIIARYLDQNGIIFTADQDGDYWNNF
jgi:hypothetical protein